MEKNYPTLSEIRQQAIDEEPTYRQRSQLPAFVTEESILRVLGTSAIVAFHLLTGGGRLVNRATINFLVEDNTLSRSQMTAIQRAMRDALSRKPQEMPEITPALQIIINYESDIRACLQRMIDTRTQRQTSPKHHGTFDALA